MKQQKLFNEIKQAMKFGAIYCTDGCIKLSHDGKSYTIISEPSYTDVTVKDYCAQDMDTKHKPVIHTCKYTGLRNSLLNLYARMYVGKCK